MLSNAVEQNRFKWLNSSNKYFLEANMNLKEKKSFTKMK